MKIKGFDKDLKCRGMQFEVGKIYDTGAKDDEIKLCSNTVFHYCKSLSQVHQYYSCKSDNRFCEIIVFDTLAPEPKNIRTGCRTHGFYLSECFRSVDEAIDAWNRRAE